MKQESSRQHTLWGRKHPLIQEKVPEQAGLLGSWQQVVQILHHRIAPIPASLPAYQVHVSAIGHGNTGDSLTPLCTPQLPVHSLPKQALCRYILNYDTARSQSQTGVELRFDQSSRATTWHQMAGRAKRGSKALSKRQRFFLWSSTGLGVVWWAQPDQEGPLESWDGPECNIAFSGWAEEGWVGTHTNEKTLDSQVPALASGSKSQALC